MVGIVAYGAYIPFNRLDCKHIRDIYGAPVRRGQKAVANYDEDSLTMAVAAALDCSTGFAAEDFSRIYFATTTQPHREKQSATTIAGTLDMRRDAVTMDITGSLRAASSAMIAGFDAAEKSEKVMVAMSDNRLGAANGINESLFGDGAAAFLLGKENVIAEVIGYHSVAVDFYDNWRSQNDQFVRGWEERFCQNEGYTRFTVEAGKAVMEKTGLSPQHFSKVIIFGLQQRDSMNIAAKLGFSPQQVQDNMIDRIGNTGVASAPMSLVAALEEARPGDNILYVTYGEGSDAIIFRVTPAISDLSPRRGIKGYIDSEKSDMNYGNYLKWRQLVSLESQRRPPLVRPSLPDRYRNLKKILGFYGTRCTVCGTPQFPPHRVCTKCQSIDQLEEYRFLGRKARLATYTLDYLAPSLDPPTVMAVVDYDGGGRFVCLMTDCDLTKVAVGMELEMSFRKLFEADGIGTYFWKAIPRR